MIIVGKNTSALGDQRGRDTACKGVVKEATFGFGFERW